MAQRNRYDEYLKRKQGIVEPSVQWKAAEYLRISREDGDKEEIGRASCRERVCQYV